MEIRFNKDEGFQKFKIDMDLLEVPAAREIKDSTKSME